MCRSARRPGCGPARAECASTCRMNWACSSAASNHVGDDPEQNGQRDAADRGTPSQSLALTGLVAVAEVPDEMPDAAEQMMHQRPCISEYDQPPDEAAGKSLHIGVGGGPGGGCDQPPRQQQGSKIQRNPGGAMNDGQCHRQGPAIGLYVG